MPATSDSRGVLKHQNQHRSHGAKARQQDDRRTVDDRGDHQQRRKHVKRDFQDLEVAFHRPFLRPGAPVIQHIRQVKRRRGRQGQGQHHHRIGDIARDGDERLRRMRGEANARRDDQRGRGQRQAFHHPMPPQLRITPPGRAGHQSVIAAQQQPLDDEAGDHRQQYEKDEKYNRIQPRPIGSDVQKIQHASPSVFDDPEITANHPPEQARGARTLYCEHGHGDAPGSRQCSSQSTLFALIRFADLAQPCHDQTYAGRCPARMPARRAWATKPAPAAGGGFAPASCDRLINIASPFKTNAQGPLGSSRRGAEQSSGKPGR
ncbi:hypothetical protein EV666_10668 [Camelimonas lactis]|uniref:Uncharacterized protein n=1 Tax=Camelimonas lactis TaxID=659006 RepID=A0A4R2GU19_9HYPH|nr:hypothetical protein EV666_10668 [Camelimonas lactis]